MHYDVCVGSNTARVMALRFGVQTLRNQELMCIICVLMGLGVERLSAYERRAALKYGPKRRRPWGLGELSQFSKLQSAKISHSTF
jgi:hypothetical protein